MFPIIGWMFITVNQPGAKTGSAVAENEGRMAKREYGILDKINGTILIITVTTNLDSVKFVDTERGEW